MPAGYEEDLHENYTTDAEAARARHSGKFLPVPSLLNLNKPDNLSLAAQRMWEESEVILGRMALQHSSQEKFNLEGPDEELFVLARDEKELEEAVARLQEEIVDWPFVSFDKESFLIIRRDSAILVGAPSGWCLCIPLEDFDGSVTRAIQSSNLQRILASRDVATVGFGIFADVSKSSLDLGRAIDLRGLIGEWKSSGFTTMQDRGAPKTGLKEAAMLLFQQSHCLFFGGRKLRSDLEKHYRHYGEDLRGGTVPRNRDARDCYTSFQNPAKMQKRYAVRDACSATGTVHRQIQRILVETAGQDIDRHSVIRQALVLAEACPVPSTVARDDPYRWHLPAPWPPLKTQVAQKLEEVERKIQQRCEERQARRPNLWSFRDPVVGGSRKRTSSPTPPVTRNEEKRIRSRCVPRERVISASPVLTEPLRRLLRRLQPWDEDPFVGLCRWCGRHRDDQLCRAQPVRVCEYSSRCRADQDHGDTLCHRLQGLCPHCHHRGHAGLGISCNVPEVRETFDEMFRRNRHLGIATRHGHLHPIWVLRPPPDDREQRKRK